MTERYTNSPFTRGAPTPSQVQDHVMRHPFIDDRGKTQGGLWIVLDEQGTFGPHPHFIRLKLGTEKDVTPHQKDKADIIIGQVVLQNGHTFWQPLSETKWGARSLYLPVTSRGLPLPGA